MTSSERALKRLFDVLVAGVGLAVLSPLMTGVAALVISRHRWPPVFIQRRPGYKERIFSLIKFRTMTNEKGVDGELLSDSARLTKLGRWLRATSIDELPELINVLRGDMSLVGPRPLLVKYLPRYTANQRRRHDVKPGITGWAQINGRNALSWDEKFALDVWYVDNASVLLDLQILLATIRKVLAREGISAVGEATMPEFLGEVSDQ